jgi:hypothetical protein
MNGGNPGIGGIVGNVNGGWVVGGASVLGGGSEGGGGSVAAGGGAWVPVTGGGTCVTVRVPGAWLWTGGGA